MLRWIAVVGVLGAATVAAIIAQDDAHVIVIGSVGLSAVAVSGLVGTLAIIAFLAWWRPFGPSYQPWSYLEVIEEDGGLRIGAGRLGARHRGLLVRRGEVVELSAEATGSVLVVSAPAGSFDVDVDVPFDELTAAPLEAVSRQLGIELRFTGAAAAIP